MDLDAYYSRYTGVGRVRRLVFAAHRATNAASAKRARELALQAVTADSLDAATYQSLAMGPAASALGVHYDAAAYDRLKRGADAKINALTKEVDIARARSQRDDVRRNLIELGFAYRDAGSIGDASGALQSAREYAANARQLSDINTSMLEMSLLLLGGGADATLAGTSGNSNQYAVSNLINKLHSSPEADSAV